VSLVSVIDARRGVKVDPPFKIFTKLVNKNAIKPQKGVPSPKKFGKNLMDPPPPGFSNPMHLWFQSKCTYIFCHFNT
jgi:hypothetical protein